MLAADAHSTLNPLLHDEIQDRRVPAWEKLSRAIEKAEADGSESFRIDDVLSFGEKQQIRELPESIGRLRKLRRLYVGGSRLVRLPAVIQELVELERLNTYTCYDLHWYPFELTRLPRLRGSCVSTRALYGNRKFRAPFPDLRDPKNYAAMSRAQPSRCSICDGKFATGVFHRRWLSRRVGTDVLPLLIFACSGDCLARIPEAAEGYVDHPHEGGLSLRQPPAPR